MTSRLEHPYVEETPRVGGGYPQLRGTRIPVWVILDYFRQLGSVEQVRELFPYLTCAQVQGALDYYAEHPARVDEDIARNREAWQALTGQPWPD